MFTFRPAHGREASIASAIVALALVLAVAALSGGNQQKVALARWLSIDPGILILDEPTQGVDVGAKAEIHALVQELAERGLAIIMISSELPEILGMSDRVAVMHAGTVSGILSRAEATQDKIIALALERPGTLGRLTKDKQENQEFRSC